MTQKPGMVGRAFASRGPKHFRPSLDESAGSDALSLRDGDDSGFALRGYPQGKQCRAGAWHRWATGTNSPSSAADLAGFFDFHWGLIGNRCRQVRRGRMSYRPERQIHSLL
jgi:hypothetical protein